MKAKEAYEKAIRDVRVEFGTDDQQFTMLGWKSPSTGHLSGPYLVAIAGDQAIEVNKHGKFLKSYPAVADHYEPWINKAGKK